MTFLDDFIKTKINEEGFAIEQTYFVKTDKRVNPKEVEPFKYFKGTLPILITAPHAVRHFRKKRIKPSDQFTGAISVLLHNKFNVFALATTKLYGGDPGYDLPCIFKEKVKEIVLTNNIKFVLDIHGASSDRDFDVDIGTMKGKSLLGNKKLVEHFRKCFYKNNINNITNDVFPGMKQNTVTKFVVEELKCPAVQLEINRKYRSHQNLHSFAQLMASLACIVSLLHTNFR